MVRSLSNFFGGFWGVDHGETELTYCFVPHVICGAKQKYLILLVSQNATCFLVRFRVNIKDASVWVNFILW